jgi:hypothetical protein
MKTEDLSYFPDEFMKVKEIARKIGFAVHAKPRLERVAWRRPFHPLGTRLAPRSLRLRKCRNSSEGMACHPLRVHGRRTGKRRGIPGGPGGFRCGNPQPKGGHKNRPYDVIELRKV